MNIPKNAVRVHFEDVDNPIDDEVFEIENGVGVECVEYSSDIRVDIQTLTPCLYISGEATGELDEFTETLTAELSTQELRDGITLHQHLVRLTDSMFESDLHFHPYHADDDLQDAGKRLAVILDALEDVSSLEHRKYVLENPDAQTLLLKAHECGCVSDALFQAPQSTPKKL